MPPLTLYSRFCVERQHHAIAITFTVQLRWVQMPASSRSSRTHHVVSSDVNLAGVVTLVYDGSCQAMVVVVAHGHSGQPWR
eukprot:42133-Eustigmatos_ZCMA.PRE.1